MILVLKCALICTVFLSICSFIIADKVTLCYVVGWAQRRPDWGKFRVMDSDTDHCTHIVYAFMGLDAATTSIRYADRTIDIDSNGTKLNQVAYLQFLKNRNPKIKVLASIGGWDEAGRKFSDVARDPEKRKLFITNMMKFLKDYSLDGLDICWQFPGQRGGRRDDTVNSVILFKELQEAFKPSGWLLTIHMIGKLYVMEKYNIKEVSDNVDFINLAAVEYNGPWERITGIMAPLTSRNEHNVLFSVEYMLKRGANSSKLLLGLPMYGHAYVTNKPVNDRYLGLKSNSTFSSPRTNEGGVIAYSEMCQNLKNNDRWTKVWDKDSLTPVAYKGRKFVSYDNVTSLLLKAGLVHSKSLGGVMIWSQDLDDFHGLCHGVKFPLITAVSDYINNRTSTNNSINEYVILCYMFSWASSRLGQGHFSVTDAKNDYCTHLIYAFMKLDNTTYEITHASPSSETELPKLKTLRNYRENLKILASVGGWNEESKHFSEMAESQERRSIFIKSLVNFIKKYDLDGMDICWQFPGIRGGRSIDKENSVKLFREIKKSFEPEGFILTVHILGHRYGIDAYDIKTVSEIVDYINFAAMEYHGTSEGTLGISNPLTSSDEENVRSSLDYILQKGVSHKKLLLGLPLFGHAFTLPEAPRGKYLGLSYSSLVTSKWTNESGNIAYNELCSEMASPDNGDWLSDWDELSETPIAYKGVTFASYENRRSLRLKAKLVNQKNLGGVMIWSIDMDDFRGDCHGIKYPLLSSVTELIYKSSPSSSTQIPSDQDSVVGIPKGKKTVIVSYEYGIL